MHGEARIFAFQENFRKIADLMSSSQILTRSGLCFLLQSHPQSPLIVDVKRSLRLIALAGCLALPMQSAISSPNLSLDGTGTATLSWDTATLGTISVEHSTNLTDWSTVSWSNSAGEARHIYGSANSGFYRLSSYPPFRPMIIVPGGVLQTVNSFNGTVVATFEIGKYEVTWDEWQVVRAWAVNNGYTDLTNVGTGVAGNHPVQMANWYDVVKWCNARSEMEGLSPVYFVNGDVYRSGEFGDDASIVQAAPSANGYRLPTTAEWEWAARGGPSSKGYVYSGSNDLNAVGWFVDNSGNSTKAVGTKAGNDLGIHDMSGNVWEWVLVPSEAVQRHRGGSFGSYDSRCGVIAIDLRGINYARRDEIGFRIARNAAPDN